MYVKNLLRISEYAPALRDKILTLITEQLLLIDVEIEVPLDGNDDHAWTAVTVEHHEPLKLSRKQSDELMFQMDQDDQDDMHEETKSRAHNLSSRCQAKTKVF